MTTCFFQCVSHVGRALWAGIIHHLSFSLPQLAVLVGEYSVSVGPRRRTTCSRTLINTDGHGKWKWNKLLLRFLDCLWSQHNLDYPDRYITLLLKQTYTEFSKENICFDKGTFSVTCCPRMNILYCFNNFLYANKITILGFM